MLCPGFNDNKELDKTIVDLFNLGENFNNLAIVPVGISKYREDLEKLEPVTFEKANQVINQVERYQKEIYNVRNRNFVYLSDEFYLTAKREFPKYSEYDGFPQIENGIGLTVKFNYEIDKALENVGKSNFNGKISIVTGFSAYENLMKIKEKVEMKFPIIKIDVIKIKNNFFGDKITVAGLITGSDILEQVDIMRLGEKVILPDVMFKDKENVFLDDTTLSDIELKFNRKISVVSVNGYEFISELIK